MQPVDFALICAAVILLIGIILYVSRKRRALSMALPQRNAMRARIVREADRLWLLEEDLARPAEGSSPGILPDDAPLKQREAARLKAALEAECRRHSLPIGLVRRRRSASLVPTVGLLSATERSEEP